MKELTLADDADIDGILSSLYRYKVVDEIHNRDNTITFILAYKGE